MTEAPFVTYDVFTDRRFGGNPLAVVIDATEVPEAMFQTIAREFGYSETTFVLPPEDPAHDAKVRIFTPTMELPFAGHPTVGTALALHEAGRAGDEMVLELGVGPIPVTVRDGVARFTTRVPLSTSPGPDAAAVAGMVGLAEVAIRTDRHSPEVARVGLPFLLAELGGDADLVAAYPDLDAFRRSAGEEAERLGLLVYLRDGPSIRARMFAPLGGVMEDPATGSAAAALTAYLGRLDGRSQSFEIVQGVEMERPSLILTEVTVEGGAPVEIAVSGRAVRVMEGRIAV